MKKLLFFVALMFSTLLFAQTTISGKVTDAQTGESLPGASITIVGKSLGTTSGFDGNYKLIVNVNPPFTIETSSIGFESMSVEVSKNNQKIDFKLAEAAEALDEVVVSASRTPERIRESPVTIERMDARAIQATSSPSFYDGLENLKGVDVNTNSLTFKSVNTRGFATFSNTRFMQLVDGMDNTSPALNFALGNLLGMNELDVNTVEILPGASSALYGANAYNGILFMTSKSPFKHTGISTYFKTGLTIQDAAGDNHFYDWGIRAAYKFSDKFAAKANFSYLSGTDWMATDYNEYSDIGVTVGEPNNITPITAAGSGFDALNRYGDEVATTLDWSAFGNGQQFVGRTGYNEVDLMDYEAKSVRADFALHYKPWANDKELIFNYRSGRGSTIYQGANRYSINDFVMNQVKLEFKGDNFFVRAYRTTETAGDSYDTRFTAINMQRDAKSDVNWFTDYTIAYNGILHNPAFGGVFAGIAVTPGDHAAARAFADSNALNNSSFTDPTIAPYQLGALNAIISQFTEGAITQWNREDNARYIPGSPEFEAAFNKVIQDPSLLTGSKFQDDSSVNHADANYNLKDIINNWADLQIGGSYRIYSLNSHGTIFTDYDGSIDYNEYGAYMQFSKKFADDRLKFTGSARYDKAQNFDGNISPRIALVYSAGETKNHNFRISYQTGFRNPTTQDQYIGLDAGRAILVGSAEDNLDRYLSNPIFISQNSQNAINGLGAGGLGATVQLSGRRAYDNAFTYSSLLAFGAAAAAGTPDITLLKKAAISYVQPEGISVYELGYRGKLGSVNLDINGYYNQYDGFISTQTVIVPNFGSVDTVVEVASGQAPSNPADITDLTPIGQGPTPNALIAVANGDIQPFQVYTNSKSEISSYGGTLGLSSKIFDKFRVGMNYTYAKFNFDQATDPDYEAGFNTPEHKIKASIGTNNLFENFGFNINYRYSTEFLWQSSMVDAIVPARSVVDAQISYKVPSFKSLFKVGGANIGGDNYMSAPGSGFIGSQYYISWTVNP